MLISSSLCVEFVLFSRHRVKLCEPRLRRRRNSTISRVPIRKLGFDAVREVHFGFASATLKVLVRLKLPSPGYARRWARRNSASEGLCGTTYEVMLAPSLEIEGPVRPRKSKQRISLGSLPSVSLSKETFNRRLPRKRRFC